MRENGITNYNRSHDNTWTACLLGFLIEITDDDIRVRPSWQEQAVYFWRKFKEEMEKGIYPDFEGYRCC